MCTPLRTAGLELAPAFDDPTGQSRRALLTAGAAAVLATFAKTANAQNGTYPGKEAAINWKSPTNRLVRRVSHGINETESAIAKQLGFRGYLERQLNHAAIDDSEVDRVILGRWPRMTWPANVLWSVEDDYPSWLAVQQSTIYRGIASRRMLYERMVEFWMDHFNVSINKTTGALALVHVRDAIRKHALGNFHVLLRATAFSPGMLHYLDNDQNSQYAPNINYSRELCELHTVSPNGGYTGRDLRELAKIFSGWTFEWRKNHPNSGKYRFDPELHAPGTKTFMGRQYTESGRAEGEQALAFLASHASTARYITQKLIKWFLGEVPPAVWTQAQQTFTNTGGDIKAVLRTILTEQNLLQAKPKFKRPAHLIVSALRSTKARVVGYNSLLYEYFYGSGHAPLEWEMPDGYPDRFEYWAPAMATRLGFGLSLCSEAVYEVETPIEQQFGQVRSASAVLEEIDKKLFGDEMGTADREALFIYLAQQSIDDERLRGAVALALASPSFQWY